MNAHVILQRLAAGETLKNAEQEKQSEKRRIEKQFHKENYYKSVIGYIYPATLITLKILFSRMSRHVSDEMRFILESLYEMEKYLWCRRNFISLMVGYTFPQMSQVNGRCPVCVCM